MCIADLAAVDEGDGTATLTVTLSASSTQNVTVGYSTADGTATAGSDYTAVANGSATITAGNTSADISIPVTDDTEDDDDETFTVTLGDAVNATLGTSTATVTITDNDDPIPGTPENLAAEPGDREVKLTWDPPSAGGAPDEYGYRYKAGSGAFGDSTTVLGGAATTTVTVTSLDNSMEHTFEVWARNATGVGKAAPIAATPIPADTSALSISGATVDEDVGTVELTVKLRPVSTQQVTVDYATEDGTATGAGETEDYTVITGTLTFAVGDTSMVLSVPINDDTADEDDETFTVKLSNATGDAAIGVATATVTIRDNDDSPPWRATGSDGGTGGRQGGADVVAAGDRWRRADHRIPVPLRGRLRCVCRPMDEPVGRRRRKAGDREWADQRDHVPLPGAGGEQGRVRRSSNRVLDSGARSLCRRPPPEPGAGRGDR